MLLLYIYCYRKTSLCFSFLLRKEEKHLKLYWESFLLDKSKNFLLLKPAGQRPLRIFCKTPECVEYSCLFLLRHQFLSRDLPLRLLTLSLTMVFALQGPALFSSLSDHPPLLVICFTSVPHYSHFEMSMLNALVCNFRIYKPFLTNNLKFKDEVFGIQVLIFRN